VLGVLGLILFSCIFTIDLTGAETRTGRGSAEIEFFEIVAYIDNNYAITEIQEKFVNSNDYAIDETFSFEIPAKAFISNFSLSIDNETYYAEIVPKDIGQEKYEEAVVEGNDAGLVEAQDKNIFSYSVSLSANQEVIVGLRYEQYIEKSLGGYRYIIPFSGGYINQNVNNFFLELNLNSKLNINTVDVENYMDETYIDTISSKYVRAVFQKTNYFPTEDYIFKYELAAPPLNGTMLNYNDGEHEYFFHIFSPQKNELGGQVMDKDIIFILDKSGSMMGEKIEQLQVAFDEIIYQLRPNDRFNLVTFDSMVMEYNTDLIYADDENQSNAVDYIYNISASGSTNINDAMSTGLGMFEYSETKVPIIVMLTDGLPTAGVTVTETIRDNVKNANTAEVAIFCLGFGFDVDFEFLKAMALENYGQALRIYQGEDASEQITGFYDTISTPLLKDLTFKYSTGTSEIYPARIEQLFEGAEVAVVGKYSGTSNTITSTVEATDWKGSRIFEENFELEENTNYSFIPRFWAYAKIMDMLDEIAVNGENESLVENVTKLALEYGFVTPYTSLLITTTPAEDDSEEENDGDYEELPEALPDSDGDGYPDNVDVYPNNPSKWRDNDDPDADRIPYHGENGTGPKDEDEAEKSYDEMDLFPCYLIFVTLIIILLLSLVGYTRIRQKRLLDHKRREMIYEYVKENPGEHFRGIQKALELEVGVVAHHINMLERGNYIKSRQDGQYRRFYPMEANIDVKLILSALQERILNRIKTDPGISQRNIATKLGIARKVVSYHVKILRDAGFIYVEKQGREALCYPAAGI
jgi:uncharacterized protein YegL/DNA-binding transcriptional ArsR family regulator